jgi:hypothetical protein
MLHFRLSHLFVATAWFAVICSLYLSYPSLALATVPIVIGAVSGRFIAGTRQGASLGIAAAIASSIDLSALLLCTLYFADMFPSPPDGPAGFLLSLLAYSVALSKIKVFFCAFVFLFFTSLVGGYIGGKNAIGPPERSVSDTTSCGETLRPSGSSSRMKTRSELVSDRRTMRTGTSMPNAPIINPCPRCGAFRNHIESSCLSCGWMPSPSRDPIEAKSLDRRSAYSILLELGLDTAFVFCWAILFPFASWFWVYVIYLCLCFYPPMQRTLQFMGFDIAIPIALFAALPYLICVLLLRSFRSVVHKIAWAGLILMFVTSVLLPALYRLEQKFWCQTQPSTESNPSSHSQAAASRFIHETHLTYIIPIAIRTSCADTTKRKPPTKSNGANPILSISSPAVQIE